MAPRHRLTATAAAASAVLLAAVLLPSSARAQGVSECPISASDAALQDYTAVKAACVAGPDFCGACSCSLINVFTPALAAAVATPEGAAALTSSDPVSLASDVLTLCVPNVLPSVVAAGVPLSSLEGLTSCDFSGDKAPVPPCLAERVAAITGGSAAEVASAADGASSKEVSAAQGPSAATATTALRVATVQQLPGGGVTATLAGQLNDVSGLLRAFAANQDLLEALPSDDAAAVRRLAAAPEALAAAPDTNVYLATLANPVDATAVIDRLVAIDATAGGGKAPPTSGGDGAPAAPSAAGSAAGLALSALAGAALAAAVVMF